MKRILALSIVVLPLWAVGQTKAPTPWSDAELATFARAYTLGTPTVSYDTVVGRRAAYSGIAIQLLRAPDPLQLFNPWAPAEYGPSEQNLVLDPLTKQPAGLRFFAIKF